MTTEIERRSADYNEAAEETEAAIVGLLKEAYRLNEASNGRFACPDCGVRWTLPKKRLSTLKARIKKYLESSREPVVVDGDNRIQGRLQDVQKSDEYELITLAERDPQAVVRLALAGDLDVKDKSAVLKKRGDAPHYDALDRVRRPGRMTTSLYIEEAQP